MAIAPSGGMDFLTDYRVQDGEVHAIGIAIILKKVRKPVVCHICGNNHYGNKYPKKDKSDTYFNKPDTTDQSSVNIKTG